VLAAHSFGCLVAAQAIGRALRDVVGALLVAPANPMAAGRKGYELVETPESAPECLGD
jgi:predicted alpha/beta hydrolase family esterase